MEKLSVNNFYIMLMSAERQLSNEAERINALNVFPVPDGDTGSNMSMTVSGVKNLPSDCMNGIGDLAGAAAECMLRFARGNSGVILSVWFRGFASMLKGVADATQAQLTEAFEKAKTAAYGAVMNPTEGTILSVMRAVADSCKKNSSESIKGYFENIVHSAKEALDKTPEQLPLLKKAGVVDAGGTGFYVILSAMYNALANGNTPYKIEFPSQKADISEIVNAAAESDSEIVYPYCTECIVEKSDENREEHSADELHRFIMGIGDSAVFVETDSIIKLHVHTESPGAVLTEAAKYGSLATVKVENMRKQHTEILDKKYAEVKEGIGFVAVSNGDGLHGILSDLGVNEVVSGGQTMNPSTNDLLDAVRSVGLNKVFILPNNSNIILTAQSAAELAKNYGIDAVVIPSKSVPQGITALYAYDDTLSFYDNQTAMTESLKNVRTLSFTHAVRDASIDGLEIRSGQVIGLCENRVKKCCDSLAECVSLMLGELEGMNCITVYYGEGLSEEETEKIADTVKGRFNGEIDLITVYGGQPVYSLIISGE